MTMAVVDDSTLSLGEEQEPLSATSLEHILSSSSPPSPTSPSSATTLPPSTLPAQRTSAPDLPHDAAAVLLSYLSLSDIASVSETCRSLHQACRSNQLWKYLFEYRWNVPTVHQDTTGTPSSISLQHYFQAYQKAHLHPHDLWVTHWNCVYPAEGLSPGRCCIRSVPPTRGTRQSPAAHAPCYCPTCRDYVAEDAHTSNDVGDAHAKPPATDTQRAAQRTHCLRQRWAAQGMPPLPNVCDTSASAAEQTTRRARHAFAAAATFHRRIDTTQYEPGVANFLTDLLFFNLTDPFTAQGHWELNQLLMEHYDGQDIPSTAGWHATGHHSWHIIELRNPDLYRPILYQFGAQRPDCFAVYPSEGWIAAGQAVHVTLGVTPLGSALAYATHGLDVQRDGQATEWAGAYASQAHLPLCPFLIRYRFANLPPTPVLEAHRRYVVSTAAHDSKEAVLEHFFQQDVAPHHFRTIYLSAHVNAQYNFWEFWGHTGQPWIEERRRRVGPLWVAPVLAEKFPWHMQILDDNSQPTLPYYRTPKYTEGPCDGCGLIWGERDEELVYEYFSALVMARRYQAQKETILRNIGCCMEVIPTVVPNRNEEAVSVLLYSMCAAIQSYKASPLTRPEEIHQLVQQEVAIDALCQRIQVGGERWISWRCSGVYRYIRCTDSVFGGRVVYETGKEEPEYLDAFRHLTHGPGNLCLGRQVDPNHVYSLVQPTSRRFVQKEGDPISDIFLDDPISALQAGICMLSDPTSLLLHGIYDRVRYPGSVVRRPRMYPSDMLPDDYVPMTPAHSATYNLLNYVYDVPPPGVGRFPLCSFNFHEPDVDTEIVEVKLFDDDNVTAAQSENTTTEARTVPLLQPRPLAMRRGPRFLQMLWTLGASLGLVVIDSSTVRSVFVDRTILIATHWISISLMIAPLLLTLTARYAQWIPSQPVDYNLEGLPFPLQNEMRYLTETECGLSAILLLGVWAALGRWSERHTYRDLFRAMLEHLVPPKTEQRFLVRQLAAFKLWLLRRWDGFCPLFLQRRVFSPHWNLRTRSDLIKHLAFWRTRNLVDHRSHASAEAGHPDKFFGDSRDDGIDFGLDSSARKIATGIIVVLASFCSSTPHFWLNLTTVFSSSVSLGISFSVQSLEKGKPEISVTNTGSFLRELNLLTVFIFAFLIGQLVGSSGGTMFLAEFIVTSISLVLGGAGTVSASAMESWMTFFILAWTAFWGFLFGRVGLIDGIVLKRRGYSTVLLSISVAIMGIFWTLVLLVGRFDSPVNLVILRPTLEESRTWSRNQAAKMLQ